jgi:hypothetical protein
MATTVEKELKRLSRAEERLRRRAHQDDFKWKTELEAKIPEKVLVNLQAVFKKAFEIIFDKGTGIIEKTYKKDEIQKDFLVRDYALDLDLNQKDLLMLNANSELSNLVSLVASTVEGVGLGALGVGLPDIVLFVSVILRGCYQTALQYGFSYDTPEEKYFILTVLEGSLLKNELWDTCNDLVNVMLVSPPVPTEEQMAEQLRNTSNAFAMDMLLMKFIQGIPVVGVVGGLANPLYYQRILNYVKLKYRKRYLLTKQ